LAKHLMGARHCKLVSLSESPLINGTLKLAII
jgi:hypothetical protein